MFETGYISNAPLFMDLMTTYFVLLPIFMMFAVRYAKQKRYKPHAIFQFFLYIASMIMVLVFEVSIRLYGGFGIFLDASNTPRVFFLASLTIHMLIAIITLVWWSLMVIKNFKAYRSDGFDTEIFHSHKEKGKLLFTMIVFTSYSGFGMYFLLFLN